MNFSPISPHTIWTKLINTQFIQRRRLHKFRHPDHPHTHRYIYIYICWVLPWFTLPCLYVFFCKDSSCWHPSSYIIFSLNSSWFYDFLLKLINRWKLNWLVIVSRNIYIQTIKGIKIIKYDRIFEIVYKMYMLRTHEVCKMIIYYF
jgi:hypothetical protein